MENTQEVQLPNEIELVTFSVCDQIFCLRITEINEIRRWSPITILPHAPADVLGVMNLRGAVIPIYDLAARFNLGKAQQGGRSVVIVSSVGNKPVGLLVDSVSEIISIKNDEIQATPDLGHDGPQSSIQGVIAIEENMVRVIDLQSVILDQ